MPELHAFKKQVELPFSPQPQINQIGSQKCVTGSMNTAGNVNIKADWLDEPSIMSDFRSLFMLLSLIKLNTWAKIWVWCSA